MFDLVQARMAHFEVHWLADPVIQVQTWARENNSFWLKVNNSVGGPN